MKYNLTDIKLRKVADGKRNAGTLFIQATVVNPDDEWDEDGSLTTFNERLVKKFAQYIGVSQPGALDQFGRQTWQPSPLLNQANPIPESMLVLTHAQFEEFKFPGGERVQLDDNGQPRRNDSGQMIVRDSVRVLTKKTVDNETGETRYANGWDPVSQGNSIMLNLYAPLSQFTESVPQGIVLPQQPETPLINGASAPAPQGAPAPNVQPAVQQLAHKASQHPSVLRGHLTSFRGNNNVIDTWNKMRKIINQYLDI